MKRAPGTIFEHREKVASNEGTFDGDFSRVVAQLSFMEETLSRKWRSPRECRRHGEIRERSLRERIIIVRITNRIYEIDRVGRSNWRNVLQKQSGYTNEAFHMENVHVERKGNDNTDHVDKSKGLNVQEKVPAEINPTVRNSVHLELVANRFCWRVTVNDWFQYMATQR